MRLAAFVAILVGAQAADADPPHLSPTGELEARGHCAEYMDFTNSVRGSAPDGLADVVSRNTFDSGGRLIGERWWRIDTPVRVLTHSYDAAGRKAKTTWRLTDNKLVKTIRYRYDLSGNLLEEVSTYANGRRYKSTNKYNSHGQLVRARKPGEGGTMATRFTYNNGRIAQELWGTAGKVRQRTTYNYDGQGRLHSKRMKHLEGDYAVQLIEFKYDGSGRLAERKNTHIWPTRPKWTGPREILRFKYDAASNLIEKTRRVTEKTGIMVRNVYDYSCRKLGIKVRSLPPAPCKSSSCETP